MMLMLHVKVNDKLYYKNILLNDGVIACPTDTVYGFFSSALSDKASKKIFSIKKRDLSKKLIVNVSDINVLSEYVYINDIDKILINNFWPGALSIIFNLNDFGNTHISKFVSGNDRSICVRIPNHPQTLELLQSVNIPLISTSVNLSGEDPINCYSDIVKYFTDKVDLIISDDYQNINSTRVPSTIIDARGGDIKIIRNGLIKIKDIENCINQHAKIIK